MTRSTSAAFAMTAALLLLAASARGGTPLEIQQALEAEARRTTPAFSGFSPERGERFFAGTHGGDWSCATCHGRDPRQPGRHATTGKRIEPLAPGVNPERFTAAATVEKWFRRNCQDVLRRACTPEEKGDVLAWLLSLGSRTP
jgi:hypothetical protein